MSRPKKYCLQATAAKSLQKNASPSVSNNPDVKPEVAVTEHTSSWATQELSQTNHPSPPDGAVSNLLLDSGSDECG